MDTPSGSRAPIILSKADEVGDSWTNSEQSQKIGQLPSATQREAAAADQKMYGKNPGKAQGPEQGAAASKDGTEEKKQCSREDEQQDGSNPNGGGVAAGQQLQNGQQFAEKQGKYQQDTNAKGP